MVLCDEDLISQTAVEELRCGLCSGILAGPVITPCQHSFCKECVEPALVASDGKCPKCHQTVADGSVIPFRFAQQRLEKLEVRCPHHQEGCLWTGHVHSRSRHAEVCLVKQLKEARQNEEVRGEEVRRVLLSLEGSVRKIEEQMQSDRGITTAAMQSLVEEIAADRKATKSLQSAVQRLEAKVQADHTAIESLQSSLHCLGEEAQSDRSVIASLQRSVRSLGEDTDAARADIEGLQCAMESLSEDVQADGAVLDSLRTSMEVMEVQAQEDRMFMDSSQFSSLQGVDDLRLEVEECQTFISSLQLSALFLLDSLEDLKIGTNAKSIELGASDGIKILGKKTFGEQHCMELALATEHIRRDLANAADVLELLRNEDLREGESYYLICSRWCKTWMELTWEEKQRQSQVAENRERIGPGPIDNLKLMTAGEESAGLKRGLIEKEDYHIVSKNTWGQLQERYGGGPPISRPAVRVGGQHVKVLLYPLRLPVFKSETAEPIHLYEWPSTSCEAFKRRACEHLDIPYDKATLWSYWRRHQKVCLEETLSRTLSENRIVDSNEILLQLQSDGNSKDVQKRSRFGVKLRSVKRPLSPVLSLKKA